MEERAALPASFLPLHFYCRNARLCQKKAAFARRSNSTHDELLHLRKFDNLVSSTIPSHPHFSDRKSEKQVAELQLSLSDVRKRILELQDILADSTSSALPKSASGGGNHKSERSTPRSVNKQPPSSAGGAATRSPRIAATDAVHAVPKSSSPFPRSLKLPMPVASSSSSAPPNANSKAKTASAAAAAAAAEFPKKLQPSWGVWTANPAAQDGAAYRTISPPTRDRSPPSKSKRHNHLSRSADALLNLNPAATTDLPSLNKADPRAEAILGGCALLATHLQSFEDRRAKLADLDSCSFDTLNSSPSSRRIAGDTAVDVSASGELLSGKLLGRERDCERDGSRDFTADPATGGEEESTTTPPDRVLQNSAAGATGQRRFRFASDFFQRRLQAQMNRRHREVDGSEEDDGGRRSPSQLEETKLQLQAPRYLQMPEGMNGESSTSTTTRDLPMPWPPSRGRTSNGSPRADVRRVDVEDEGIGSDVERRRLSTHGQRRASYDNVSFKPRDPPAMTPRKQKSSGILSLMDSVIRRAADSDSDTASPSSNTASPLRQRSANAASRAISGAAAATRSGIAGGVTSPAPLIQGLQVDALEKKIGSLQGLVGDLKESIESFTSRVEEDGDSWYNRVVGVEKQIKAMREEAEADMASIRGRTMTKEEVKARLEELSRGLDRRLSEAESSVRRHVDAAVCDATASIVGSVDDRITQSVKDLHKGFKDDVHAVEVGISKDLDNLETRLHQFKSYVEQENGRRAKLIDAAVEERIGRLAPLCRGDVAELASEIRDKLTSDMRAEAERWRRAEAQRVEAMIEEKLQKMRVDDGGGGGTGGKDGAEKAMAEELRLLWSEVDLLAKGREELKSSVQKLTEIAEQAKEAINKEHVALKTENTNLKKQVQYFKKESMETRAEVQEMKTQMEMEVQSLRTAVGRVKELGDDTKDSVCRLQKAVSEDKRAMERRIKEELGDSGDGRERSQIMERIEKISMLYLGGLEEVRKEIDDTKVATANKMAAVEAAVAELAGGATEESLRELLLDGFETRISHLENKLEAQSKLGLIEEEAMAKVQSIVAALHQEREQAASELETVRRHSLMAQSDKDAAAAALSELLRIREHVEKEKESAISVIAEAKAKTAEYHEGLATELRSGMRNSMANAEKEIETALNAASRAAKAAEEAEAALGHIVEVKRKSAVLSEDVSRAVSQTRAKWSDEVEGHIKTLSEEVSRARSHAARIEEERRNSVGHLEGWKQTMQEEVNKARSVIHGIEQEKRKSLSVAELAVVHEKQKFEKHVQETETTMQEVMKTVQEAKSAMETKMQAAAKKQAELEERERRAREEVAEIRNGVAEALKKVEEAAKEEAALASTVAGVRSETAELGKSAAAWSQKYESACKVFQEIEKRLCALEKATVVAEEGGEAAAAAARVTIAEKQRLVALHKELAALLRRTRSSAAGAAAEQWPEEDEEWEQAVDAKLVALDAKIEHVGCASESGLRALESRTAELSMNVQAAMEGAAEAQRKCSSLGSQVVRTLRMLAPPRKDESPGKSRKEEMADGYDIAVESGGGGGHSRQQLSNGGHHNHHHHGNKAAKASPPCTYCNKRSATNSKSGGNVEDYTVESSSSSRVHGSHHPSAADATYGRGVAAAQHRYDMEGEHHYNSEGSRNSSPVQARKKANGGGGRQPQMTATEEREEYGSVVVRKRENNAELKVFEGKLPITNNNGNSSSSHHGHGGGAAATAKDKNCQSTNIRLEAGKIQVNVSHRSAVLSSGTGTGRRGGGGDVAPDNNNVSIYAA